MRLCDWRLKMGERVPIFDWRSFPSISRCGCFIMEKMDMEEFQWGLWSKPIFWPSFLQLNIYIRRNYKACYGGNSLLWWWISYACFLSRFSTLIGRKVVVKIQVRLAGLVESHLQKWKSDMVLHLSTGLSQ